MTIELRVPVLGESVKEATVGRWIKQPGEAVAADEIVLELETEKVAIEVRAPSAGIVGEAVVREGETVEVGALLGSIKPGAAVAAPPKPAVVSRSPAPAPRPAPAPAAVPQAKAPPVAAPVQKGPVILPPPSERSLDDVIRASQTSAPMRVAAATAAVAPSIARAPSQPADAAREERVRMTRLRQTIARRLKDAQNTAAMLTTFNDVDMGPVMELRKQYKDAFEKKHGVKLGFMSFFVKASIEALKEIPAVNAEIDGTDIVYKNYYHVGVAVGTERGLVVPVIRDADKLTFAGIEGTIVDFGARARDGKLGIEEMQGGTFTISNGGIYGSLLSTPILNAPQSGILGMHRIEERPVVRNGQIVARPMMYLALSYDHRIVDGKEAVTFLVRVKEGLEDPKRLILEL